MRGRVRVPCSEVACPSLCNCQRTEIDDWRSPAPVCRNRHSPTFTSGTETRHQVVLVGVAGIEPATSSLSGTRSNQLSYTPKKSSILDFRLPICILSNRKSTICHRKFLGGGNRVRTGDPELAKLVLCQLSYAPRSFPGFCPTGQLLILSLRSGSGVTKPDACVQAHLRFYDHLCTVPDVSIVRRNRFSHLSGFPRTRY